MLKKSIYARDEKVIKFLAKKIKELRRENEMTQEELANEAEIGIAQLKRIESGNINTSISTAYRISNALNVKIKDLFEDFEKK